MKTIYEMINKKRLNESKTVDIDGEELLVSDILKVFGQIYIPKYNISAVEKIDISSKKDFDIFKSIYDKYFSNKYLYVKTNVVLKNTEFVGDAFDIKIECKNKVVIENVDYLSLKLIHSENCNISVKQSNDMAIIGNMKTLNAVDSVDINLDGRIESLNFTKSSGNLYNDSKKCSVGKIALKNDSLLTNDDNVKIGSKDIDDSSKYYEDMNYSD